MPRAIPVRNLYYLLLYAWDRLPEGRAVDVSGVEGPELPNLLAKVLLEGTRRLLRGGLDRGYVERDEDTARPRGRMLVAETVSRNLLPRAQVACRADELSRDVPHNRIVKATLARLARTEEVEPALRGQLAALARGLGDVAEVTLSAADFRRVQLHGNNALYGLLLRVCALVHECLVPHQGGGRYRFRDFLADERAMGLVFQAFVRGFYERELDQCGYRVGSDALRWTAETGLGWGHELLPSMQTDVTLRSETRTLIVECKWCKEPLRARYGRPKLRSDHLYQLFAYLRSMEERGGQDVGCEGLLLYAMVDRPANVMVAIQGHLIRVRTLDLSADWCGIREQLLNLAHDTPAALDPEAAAAPVTTARRLS